MAWLFLRSGVVVRYVLLVIVCLLGLGLVSEAWAYEVVIHPNPQGQFISEWGYDIKQGGKSKDLSPGKAHDLFVVDGMNLLRVPIWGNKSKPAHPADGVVLSSYYKDDLYAMTNARNARPDVKFFASKKLNGQESFPDWVKTDSGIIPEQYARLVADYLEFFEERGFVFDVLGIDNEDSYNEGQMTANPWRHKETVDHLRVLAEQRGFYLPLIIGPEDYGPKPDWMREMVENGWGDRVDIVGTHYYPRWRPMSKLLNMLSYAGDRPIWHTEVHWDNSDEMDVIDEGEHCLAAVFDCFDVGFTGMAWWAYTRSGIKGDIEKTLVQTTMGHRPIAVEDFDGSAVVDGRFVTRAYRFGDHVSLWVINNSTTTFAPVRFMLSESQLATMTTYVQWTPTQTFRGRILTDSLGGFSKTIPARTISCFEMTWDPPEAVAHYRFDGDILDTGTEAQNTLPDGRWDFDEGRLEQSLVLDQSDHDLEIPHPQGQDYTLTFWLNTNTLGRVGDQWQEGAVFLRTLPQEVPRDMGLSIMGGNVAYGTRGPSREGLVVSQVPVNDGLWHHVVAARNAATGEMKLYVDGQLEAMALGEKGDMNWHSSLYLGPIGGGACCRL